MQAKRVTFEEMSRILPRVYQSIIIETKIGAIDAGLDAEREMKSFINIKTQRQRRAGKNSIRDYIKSYYSKDLGTGGFYYGIGEISLLNQKAKYWARLDKGFLPPAYPGYFMDKGGRTKYGSWERPAKFGTQIFYPSWSYPRMIPKKAYGGMNYIYHTHSYLMRILGRYIQARLKTVKT
jgi:hypothetical protein